MELKVYNTKTHKKEKFTPKKNKNVNMYVCGPTVYDFDHLGHARVGIFYDIVRRFLSNIGYKVTFVQNITDVGHLTDDADTGEDKILQKAKQEKKDPKDIAGFFEKAHFQDMKKLNVLKPDKSPKATDIIPQIINYIKLLISKKIAYENNGSVYFDIKKFTNYGKLSNRDFSQQKAGLRVKVAKDKKNPADFALWIKANPGHLMQWDSPWGKGYPGWHIECSVFNQIYFPKGTDIHGGAVELVFPHHENEMAQSESIGPKPFVKYWIHIGLVLLNSKKMSKSKGNYIFVKDILKEQNSDTIRVAMIMTHYRKPLDWKKSVIEQAETIRQKLLSVKFDSNKNHKSNITNLIRKALCDDFNTPLALKFILDNISKLNKNDIEYIENIFGLKLEKEAISENINKLAKKRELARKNKDFKLSDSIRQVIEKKGYVVEDTKSGSKVRKK